MATLHNLLSNYRDQNVRNRENVHEWKVDGFLVDWECLGHPLGVGVMFDQYTNQCSNNIGREGVAVFYPAVHRLAIGRHSECLKFHNCFFHPGESDSLWSRQEAVLIMLHEGGHSFGFMHAWALNILGAEPTIMSNANHSYSGCPSGCPIHYARMQYNQEENKNKVDFYRHAAEAWVRPGRYGVLNLEKATIPQYYRR